MVAARAMANVALDGSRYANARENTFSIYPRLARPTPATDSPDVRFEPPSIAR